MLYDIAIIGAGPSGLAAAARLRERTPSALFTNEEHARYWKKYRKHSNSLEQEHKRRKLSSTDSGYGSENEQSPEPELHHPSIVVLDSSSSEWLSTWKQRFKDLKISHLRSPLFFHPDPQDRDGLLAFAHEQNRADELREISNVVGKELSKHEKKRERTRKPTRTTARHLRIDGRDQIDYYTPSAKLFEDYCEHVIDRYQLQNVVRQARVLDIAYDLGADDPTKGVFAISTASTTTDQASIENINSRIVIVATGPTSSPSLPTSFSSSEKPSIAHVFQPQATHLPLHIHNKLLSQPTQPVHILVVGGGLTSAQLTHLLLMRYPSPHNIHVHLVLRRSKLQVKPFDVNLPWVSKLRNHLMSTFWSADSDEERLNMLRQARGGGSVTGEFSRLLDRCVTEERATVHVETELDFGNESKGWIWNGVVRMWINPAASKKGDCACTETTSYSTLPNMADHIIFCTGMSPSFTDIPFLQTLRKDYPIGTLGGLPVLNDELAWNDEVPCFFTGALAALRLGPGAANLAGARLGAERVAWGVERVLDGFGRNGLEAGGLEDAEGLAAERDEFTGSFRNQFVALSVE